MRDVCPICDSELRGNRVKYLEIRTGGISYGTRKIKVSPQAADLLGVLAKAYPRMITKEAINDIMYFGKDVREENDLTAVLICALRKKIPELGMKICTEWGRGYRLEIINPLTDGEIIETVVEAPTKELQDLEEDLRQKIDDVDIKTATMIRRAKEIITDAKDDLVEIRNIYDAARLEISQMVREFEHVTMEVRDRINKLQTTVDKEVELNNELVPSLSSENARHQNQRPGN